jgi:hypothetical protein
MGKRKKRKSKMTMKKGMIAHARLLFQIEKADKIYPVAIILALYST